MKFDRYLPNDRLKNYIKYYVVSENDAESEYTVFPTTGLVIGFQYQGQLSAIQDSTAHKLSSAGISGMADRYKVFKNSADIGTVLVYFTAVGFAQFSSCPAHELFDASLPLDDVFDKSSVAELEEKLAAAATDLERIQVVEQFLLTQLNHIQTDRLIVEAVKLIYLSRGMIKISELNRQLSISQSPFEKRFRKLVGTSPKKFASVVRFHSALSRMNGEHSLTEIGYESNFYDQAHFIRDFRRFTGQSPEKYKRALRKNDFLQS